jgi:hypothetical protein
MKRRQVTLHSCLQVLELLRANRDERSRVSHEPNRQPDAKAKLTSGDRIHRIWLLVASEGERVGPRFMPFETSRHRSSLADHQGQPRPTHVAESSDPDIERRVDCCESVVRVFI